MMPAIEAEAAKALVQAGVNGLIELVQKVPTLFKRQGKTREQYAADEIARTVTRLQAVTGSELERERTRQEAVWEFLLRGLLAEYPDAAEDLKALAAEMHATSETRRTGGVAGVVNAGRDAYVAGDRITIIHEPARSDSQLELSAVTLVEADPPEFQSMVLDVKLRNIGGQPAVLHRAAFYIHDAVMIGSMTGFRPYELWLATGVLEVSHVYGINLPLPHQAAGTSHNLDLSQAIEPAGTDRFHIQLGLPSEGAFIYGLHFDIHYDKDKAVTSPAIVVHRGLSRGCFAAPDEIRHDLHNFYRAVREVRDAVDREMTARGLPVPDWDNHPPAGRANLPPKLHAVDGNPGDILGLRSDTSGSYMVRDSFWNPDSSVAQRLDRIQDDCTRVVSIINDADVRHGPLPQILTKAQTILEELPAIRAEFS